MTASPTWCADCTVRPRMPCVSPETAPALTMGDGRRLTLTETIGRGSCGTVYRGLLEGGWGLTRTVAVKLFDSAPEVDAELMRGLADVSRRAAAIAHASVVRILEVDRAPGPRGLQPFVVTELVEGESLAALVEGWHERGLRVPTDFALVVATRVAEGVAAALFADRADGSVTALVHGDVSARQVLISREGEVKVGDFGHGYLRDIFSHVRTRAAVTGVAPEVAAGAEPDARSDVFSIGVLLHELLLGPRFAPRTDFRTALDMVQRGAFHASIFEPNLPRGLRDVIATATAAEPERRYPHARSLAFDLRREMLRFGLCDAQTSVRHAVVGWCDVRASAPPSPSSELVPKLDEDTAAETRRSRAKRR